MFMSLLLFAPQIFVILGPVQQTHSIRTVAGVGEKQPLNSEDAFELPLGLSIALDHSALKLFL
jgi:hypothetical protein